MNMYLGRALYPAMLPPEATIEKEDITNDSARKMLVAGVVLYAYEQDRFMMRWIEELFGISLPPAKRPHKIHLKPDDIILVPKGTKNNLTFSSLYIMDFEVK